MNNAKITSRTARIIDRDGRPANVVRIFADGTLIAEVLVDEKAGGWEAVIGTPEDANCKAFQTPRQITGGGNSLIG